MKIPRESFVLYRSVWDSADCMPDDSSKLRFLEMILAFGLDGVVPEKEKSPEYAAFLGAYKSIESACNRHDAATENGKKGGRPPNAERTCEDTDPFRELHNRFENQK